MRGIPQGRQARLVLAVVMLLTGLCLALVTDLTGSWGVLLWAVAWVLSAGGVLLVVDLQRQRRRDGVGGVGGAADRSAPDEPGTEGDGQTTR